MTEFLSKLFTGPNSGYAIGTLLVLIIGLIIFLSQKYKEKPEPVDERLAAKKNGILNNCYFIVNDTQPNDGRLALSIIPYKMVLHRSNEQIRLTRKTINKCQQVSWEVSEAYKDFSFKDNVIYRGNQGKIIPFCTLDLDRTNSPE